MLGAGSERAAPGSCTQVPGVPATVHVRTRPGLVGHPVTQSERARGGRPGRRGPTVRTCRRGPRSRRCHPTGRNEHVVGFQDVRAAPIGVDIGSAVPIPDKPPVPTGESGPHFQSAATADRLVHTGPPEPVGDRPFRPVDHQLAGPILPHQVVRRRAVHALHGTLRTGTDHRSRPGT